MCRSFLSVSRWPQVAQAFRDGRPFLTGDKFSRADVTAAALLAPLLNPTKHPTYAALKLPVALAATIREWSSRPVLRWVSDIYAHER